MPDEVGYAPKMRHLILAAPARTPPSAFIGGGGGGGNGSGNPTVDSILERACERK